MDTSLALSSFNPHNVECYFDLVLKCTELVSVNTATQINTYNKVVFDAPWTVQFKQEMRDQIIFADPVRNCPWITPTSYYFLAVKYVMKHHFWSRDLDNVHKYTQDMIADACHINDSHILEVHIWKDFKPGDYEYMIIKFGISNHNYNEMRN